MRMTTGRSTKRESPILGLASDTQDQGPARQRIYTLALQALLPSTDREEGASNRTGGTNNGHYYPST